MPEIKPLKCPFCESENLEVLKNDIPFHNYSDGYYVYCFGCSLHGPVAQSIECSIGFWNILLRKAGEKCAQDG